MHCLIIVCKYLSHKPDYQRSRFKYLQICFTVSVIVIFGLIKRKRLSRSNSDDIADQMMEWNIDNTLGIPRANLELKHSSSVHNFFQFGAMIDYWMKEDLQLLVRNKYIAICVFRILWLVFYTLLANTCSKSKVETLYKHANNMLTAVKISNKNTRTISCCIYF